MDQVFAPWRMEWVERDGGNEDLGDCPFCSLAALDEDRERRVVARGEHAFVLLNNYPYNPGHLMVIPYAHTGAYRDLDDGDLLGHARLKARTLDALADAYDPDGFNTGLNLGEGVAAGGSVDDHLHTHVVPRYEGDTNFMPVTADATVIVEGLADTYDRLHEAFAAQDDATVVGEDDAVELAV
jgi:ATP adenylyltransferase